MNKKKFTSLECVVRRNHITDKIELEFITDFYNNKQLYGIIYTVLFSFHFVYSAGAAM